MVITRRTLCVLAALSAPLGSLAAAQAAFADTSVPTVQSVQQNGQPLTIFGAGDGYPQFYTNDTTDPLSLTVAGDPTASNIALSYNEGYWQNSPPDSNGDATFTVANSGSYAQVMVEQTVGTVTSQEGDAQVATDVVPYLTGVPDGGTVNASDVQFGVGGTIPDEPVELFIDGQQAATAVADSSGNVNLPPTDQLAPGPHTAYAKTVDAQGYLSDPSSPINFTVAAPPPAPTISSITEPYPASGFASSITPAADGSFYVNDTSDQLTVQVTGEPGASMSLTVDPGTPNAQTTVPATADGNGNATLTLPAALTKTTHTLEATQTVGGATGAPADVTVHTDVTPTVGPNSAGSTIPEQEPSFPVTGGIPGQGLHLSYDAGNGGSTQNADAQGDVPASAGGMTVGHDLSPGPHEAAVQSIDAEGHYSDISSPLPFNVILPTPSIVAVTDGETVVTGQPTIDDNVDHGYTSNLYVDGSNTPIVSSGFDYNNDEQFTLPQPLSDGTHTLRVSAVDGNGNEGPKSAPITITVHSTPPTVDDTLNGKDTTDTAPSFRITGGAPNGTGYVVLTSNGGHTLVDFDIVSYDADGDANYTPSTPLADNQYALYAANTDAQGNGSAQSSTVDFSVVPAVAPVTHTGAASGQTSTAAELSGTVNAENSDTTYYFEYGATVGYGQRTATVDAGSGSSAVPVKANLSGLTPGATYHYRLVAVNATGTTDGADETFTTTAPTNPTPPAQPSPPAQVAPPAAAATVTPTRVPLRFEFDASASGAASGHKLTGYLWSLDGKVIGTKPTLTYTFPRSGQYQVELTVKEDTGQTATTTVSVNGVERVVAVSATLHFAWDSYKLTATDKRMLARLRREVAGSSRVTITGYCATGQRGRYTAAWLSHKRAEVVARSLFGAHPPLGVRVVIVARGTAHPIATNGTAAGRGKNRRTVVRYERPKADS